MLIETNFQENPFVAVPRHVVAMTGKAVQADPGRKAETFSAEALGVLVWLALRPVGVQVAVPSIRRALNLGEDRWQRVARELRAAGALVLQPIVSSQSGRVFGNGYSVRWPDGSAVVGKASKADKGGLIEVSPRPGKPGSRSVSPRPGKPRSGTGFSRYEKRENPVPLTIEQQKKGGSAPDCAPSAKAGSAPPLTELEDTREGDPVDNFSGVVVDRASQDAEKGLTVAAVQALCLTDRQRAAVRRRDGPVWLDGTEVSGSALTDLWGEVMLLDRSQLAAARSERAGE